MKLTKASAGKLSLPLGKSDMLVFDGELPGFGIRLRAGGKRTWFAQYRIGSRQRRLSIGSAAVIDADEARKRAKAALAKAHLGIDPQSERQDTKAAVSVTLLAAIEEFLDRSAKPNLKPRSYDEVSRHLKQHWKPLHKRGLKTIERADVALQLGVLARENGPFASNRARAALSGFFSWALGEGMANINAVTGTNKATDEITRDRVLTLEELALAWQLAGTGDYGAIVRLAILTAQRREEIGGMLRSELDLDAGRWRIGSERTKNGLPHEVPLSAAAISILKKIDTREGSVFVFGSREGPFQGWSNAKRALDTRMLEALQKKHGTNAMLTPWRFHDIRRSVATGLGDIGMFPHIVEAILNHISGHKSGVAGVYNRAIYASEKREALEQWAHHVAAIIPSEA